MKLIQIIGTQRSGSNLLRTMLNQLPEITAPHPPHILKTFAPLVHLYGDLSLLHNFERLVDDVCTWVELNPVPWKTAKFNRTTIQNQCKGNSLVELFYVLYASYAEYYQSKYTCCKSMGNVHQYTQLEAVGLQPYYIYLHRDGRDVACSFKKAMVGEKHVYHIAKQWRADQEKSLEVKQNTPSERFVEIKYQDLITTPKPVLLKICAFLKVPYRISMLDYFQAEESINTAKSGKMWENLSQPIMKGNYNKYKTELNPFEIKIFESIAGDMLEQLGYTATCNYRNLPHINALDIEAFDLQNSKSKKDAVLTADQHDIEVRCPQQGFLKVLNRELSNEKTKEHV